MKKIPLALSIFVGLFILLAVPTVALTVNPDFSESAEKFIAKNCASVSGNLTTDALCFLLTTSQDNEASIDNLNQEIEKVSHSKNKSLYVYDNKGNMLGPLVSYYAGGNQITVYSMLLNLIVNINPESGTITNRSGASIYYEADNCTGTAYINYTYINDLIAVPNDDNTVGYYSANNSSSPQQIMYKSSKSWYAYVCTPYVYDGEPIEETPTSGPMDNVIVLSPINGLGEKLDTFLNLPNSGLPLKIKFE